MANYDPDLEPIFSAINGQFAAAAARLDQLEAAPVPQPQPDLSPIFEGINAQLAAIAARLEAIEARPTETVDLSPLLDRLNLLEADTASLKTALAAWTGSQQPPAPEEPAPPAEPPVEPPVQPPAEPPVQPPVPSEPIWNLVKQSRITIPAEVFVPAGQRDIYIPVSVDHTDRESFYCYVEALRNVNGGGINVGNGTQQRANFEWHDILYRWSPGDDLTHYVKIVTKTAYAAGKSFEAHIRVKGLGDGQKGRMVKITFADDAQHPDMPPQFHRPLRRLDLSQAQRKNRFDPASLPHHDSGFKDGAPVWRSRLSHGYSQEGNGETGLYMNEDRFPGKAVRPISYDAAEKAVRLHTLAFPMDARAEYNSKLWRHQAVMLNGQTLDEVCGVDGVWRMEAKIPIRRYSWPAFWLIGRGSEGAKGSWTQWPPEIDILEKFNHAWGAADTPFTTTYAQHFGNAGSNSRKGSFGQEIEVNQWLPGTGALHEGYHSWACAVTYHDDPMKAEVTFFFDDVEVGCQVLHARHQDLNTRLVLFPMMNVAVRAPSTYTPEQYNTDDGRGHSGDMLVRDMGYYPSGWTFA